MLLLLSDCLMDSREDSNSRIVKHIQKMVAEKYYEPITLHSIAESMYMNPDYLSRLFKKEIGTSFSDYLTLYRIDAAKGMLSDVSSKSYEVGYAVGYQNPSHFAKMFKKVTGYSVSQFRSNAENDR
jgi:two-component system response regulator YesN